MVPHDASLRPVGRRLTQCFDGVGAIYEAEEDGILAGRTRVSRGLKGGEQGRMGGNDGEGGGVEC